MCGAAGDGEHGDLGVSVDEGDEAGGGVVPSAAVGLGSGEAVAVRS